MDILNHKNLTTNLAFETLPQWFKIATTSNAVILFDFNIITWKKGTWENGTWENGTWEKGYWENGTWENGTWENGTWKKGTWENGTWENGTWENGYKFIGFCKWSIYYSKDLIKIGCKEMSILDWDIWFKGSDIFNTQRDTKEFELIYKSYLLAKFAVENNI